MQTRKAILVVSFGTSYANTRKKTLDRIEQDIAQKYKDYRVYRAFTSKVIISIINRQEQIKIMTVKEAMEQMINDEINELIVQPTHIINGLENDIMLEEVKKYASYFDRIRLGAPLLHRPYDYQTAIIALKEILPPPAADIGIIFMGHGSLHASNVCYTALNHLWKEAGYDNVRVATLEAYPYIEDIIEEIRPKKYRKIVLLPFLVVAGGHARRDMAGSRPDSWESLLKNEGYEVEVILKGLGELKAIRELYLNHIALSEPLEG